jgi:two-component system, cell cycle sensor histidine kinase and response regulator CckA
MKIAIDSGQSARRLASAFANRRRFLLLHVLLPAALFLAVAINGVIFDFWLALEQALHEFESPLLHEAILILIILPVFLAWSAFGLSREYRSSFRRAQDAELAARELHRRLQEFLEVGADWMWEIGPDLRFTYISERIEQELQIAPNTFLGRAVWELFVGSKGETALLKQLRRDLTAGLPNPETIIPLRDREGAIRYLRINSKPFFDDDGRLLGHRGTARNVTKHVESEKRAEVAHLRLVAAVENMPAAVMLFDAEERLVLWNSRIGEFYPEQRDLFRAGTPYTAFVESAVQRKVVHADQLADPEWAARRLASFRSEQSAELQRLASGRWLQATDTKTSDGGTICVRMDVTDLKTHEQELKSKTELMRTILESMDQGLQAFDSDLKQVASNRRMLELLDLPKELGQIGTPIQAIFRYNAERGEYGSGDVEAFVAERTARARQVQAHTYERTRPNGNILEIRRKPMPGGGFVTTYADVTQRRQTEAQLRQSQKMDSVGQMAGGVAHEFNNMLTAISGFGRMALRRPDEGEHVRTCVGEMLTAADRAADITRQLLAFSRKQVLDPVLVSIADSVKETGSMLRPMLGAAIELKLAIEPITANVMVDRGQLSQVIVNLALNARDAMPNGGALTIGTGVAPLPKRLQMMLSGNTLSEHALLWVKDTGMGMDAETKRKIFEPFFTTKEEGKGTGLGLAVVQGIVEQSGGHIELESEVGHGTTFRIYLPLVESNGLQSSDDDHAAPLTAQRPATVLLVEDEDAVRRLIHTQLEEMGYKVISANDGQEALRVAKNFAQPIDLLLTDVVMPRMGGLEAARRLSTSRPDMQVVYITGHPQKTEPSEGKIAAGACVLPKPFDERQLGEIIRKALAR